MNENGRIKANYLGLFTDLYQLRMAQSYWQESMSSPATFNLFTRASGNKRGYLVSSGLESFLHYLIEFGFSPEAIDYLNSTDIFTDDFLDYISRLTFTGKLKAIPEGRIYFFNEPIIEITAPIIEAQIVETLIINQINISTLISSKAARCVWAAQGKTIMDFSARRAHGIDAGIISARSSYLAGFESTSNVLAGYIYNIPISGTMAHSYVTSFENEIDSFRAFVRSFPNDAILLVDTYDPLDATVKVIEVAHEMENQGNYLIGVRIDSGDLVGLSRQIRYMLDQSNLEYVKILVSGGLDEFSIQSLVSSDAPIDGFGIGTKIGVSHDLPSLDIVYKMVSYNDHPVIKVSPDKETIPCSKQVHRITNDNGMFSGDLVTMEDEILDITGSEKLLETYMENGHVKKNLPTLSDIRETFYSDFSHLDDTYKSLSKPQHYPVNLSSKLSDLYKQLVIEINTK
jgi:nicotinate phosphoribosyltransferase